MDLKKIAVVHFIISSCWMLCALQVSKNISKGQEQLIWDCCAESKAHRDGAEELETGVQMGEWDLDGKSISFFAYIF